MAAATSDQNTERRSGKVVSVPLAAGVKIFGGTLVARNASGYGRPAADAAGLKVVGVAQRTVDNTGGANGAVSVDVEKAVARLANSGTAPLGITHCEGDCYVADDSTVAATGGTNSIKAGRVLEVDPADATFVWVDVSRAA